MRMIVKAEEQNDKKIRVISSCTTLHINCGPKHLEIKF